MAKTITITYVAPVAPVEGKAAQICATFVPTNAAADMPAVAGTYYDTNVEGIGTSSLEAFMNKMVAHPGLIAALRAAKRDGSFVMEATDMEAIYMNEVAPAIAEEGFKIEVTDANADANA